MTMYAIRERYDDELVATHFVLVSWQYPLGLRRFECFQHAMEMDMARFRIKEFPDGSVGLMLPLRMIPGQHFSIMRKDEFDIEQKRLRKFLEEQKITYWPDLNVPQYEHDSVDTFLAAIGFDIKTRKLKSWAFDRRRDMRTTTGREFHKWNNRDRSKDQQGVS